MFNLKEEIAKLMEAFVQKEFVPVAAGAGANTNVKFGGCMDCSNSCAENCAVKCKASKR